jgi:hypothetical protein
MRWKGALDVGYDFTFSSPFQSAASGTLTAVPATFRNVQFEDVYNTPFRMGVDVAYGVNNFAEVFARFSYTRADSKRASVGTYTLAVLPVDVQLDNYNAYNARIGYRQYIPLRHTLLTPYIAPHVGVSYVNSIKGDLTVPATSVTFNDVQFFDASLVPTIGVDVGIVYPVSNAFALGAESGIQYQFNLKDDDGFFGGVSATGLEGVNNKSTRVSIPLAIKGIVKF